MGNKNILFHSSNVEMKCFEQKNKLMAVILKHKFVKYSDNKTPHFTFGEKKRSQENSVSELRSPAATAMLNCPATSSLLLLLMPLSATPAVTNSTLKTRYQGIPEAKAHNKAFKPVR